MDKFEMDSNKDLRHLQNILLLIIGEIDELCKKHNITYYLNGGNALGAVRHNGFIPWDDDFDIMMHTKDYQKLIEVCRSQLDPEKWYIQEAWVDWPGSFSKIRLKGTYLEDVGEWKEIDFDNRGIYIDIFEIVNAPSSKFLKYIQYFAAKLLNAHSLLRKGYETRSFLKKTAIFFSKALNNKKIFTLAKSLVYRYSGKDTREVANFYGMSRFKNAFYRKEIFSTPSYHKFEGVELPLPTDYHQYLRQSFGDYMKLPPVEEQKPAHSTKVDFGKY